MALLVFACCVDHRFSAIATPVTVGASPPMGDQSAAPRWPIKSRDVKVGEAVC